MILVVLQWPSERLQIIACNVGQGDGILLIKGSVQVVVDGGPSGEKILACLEKYAPFWDRTIELIVLTNTDFDHMNGLVAVVERYTVEQFVTADGVHASDSLERMIKGLSQQGVSVRGIEQGDVIKILRPETLEFSVLWPPELIEEYVAIFSDQMDKKQREQILSASAKRGDLNERSVVLLLLEDNKKYLLMGDVGFQAEAQLVKSGTLSQVDYLKVGHHGSKYATSREFLELVRPKIAVISVGANNRYGHPTRETLDRLQLVGSVVKRTDQIGSVETFPIHLD